MNQPEILQNIARHVSLDKQEESFFLSLLSEKHLKRKELLLSAGEMCKTENFIVSGCLRVYTVDENGTEHVTHFGTENWWVGDLYSFLTQTPATYFIDALEDTVILQLSKPAMDMLYERVPKFERFFRILFQNAFIAQQQRIDQNLSSTAEQRYELFLEKYPHLEQRITQKQMAAYLGITPEFLSALRRKKTS